MSVLLTEASSGKNWKFYLSELVAFGVKEFKACTFAGSFFILLIVSNYVTTLGLPRYDFLLLGAITIQGILLWLKLETWDEVKTILLFHLVGFCLEMFETQWGSWSYPEFAYTKILTVPLYSGFMYSAIGSYIIQAWRNLELRLENYPPEYFSLPLSLLAYVNFFTNNFAYDFRWLLIAATLLLFWKTKVYFVPSSREYWMPLNLAFAFIGFFIWIAENLATFFKAWQYPDQEVSWQLVHASKISSWFLLFILSFIIVVNLKILKDRRRTGPTLPVHKNEHYSKL